jgi:hypothetical protein
MDAGALPDEQHERGRRRRVGLAPQWQVPTPGSKAGGTVTQKPVSPGRARYKPLTPLRREGRNVSAYLW